MTAMPKLAVRPGERVRIWMPEQDWTDWAHRTQLIHPCHGGPDVTHQWKDLGAGVFFCTAGGEILTEVPE